MQIMISKWLKPEMVCHGKISIGTVRVNSNPKYKEKLHLMVEKITYYLQQILNRRLIEQYWKFRELYTPWLDGSLLRRTLWYTGSCPVNQLEVNKFRQIWLIFRIPQRVKRLKTCCHLVARCQILMTNCHLLLISHKWLCFKPTQTKHAALSARAAPH